MNVEQTEQPRVFGWTLEFINAIKTALLTNYEITITEDNINWLSKYLVRDDRPSMNGIKPLDLRPMNIDQGICLMLALIHWEYVGFTDNIWKTNLDLFMACYKGARIWSKDIERVSGFNQYIFEHSAPIEPGPNYSFSCDCDPSFYGFHRFMCEHLVVIDNHLHDESRYHKINDRYGILKVKLLTIEDAVNLCEDILSSFDD